ncbi:MAG: hypothetical protein FJ263_06525 [Planctomycetes bacterium]|nr:hypothetical protein [Planctomycetota bacterium]
MKAKQNVTLWICGISILVFGMGIVGATQPFENLPQDTVLAEVLGQKVCLKDIEPGSEVKEKHQDAAGGFSLWLKQTRASNLGRYFRPLWDDYAKEKGLEVTDREVNEYKERMIHFMTDQKEKWNRKKDDLAKELIAENLKDDKKAQLEKSFNLYKGLIERTPDTESIYHSADSNTAKLIDDSTKSFILDWKIRKELYKQYKGRVIFQQAGPEPLDAFRLFFEEQQRKSKFKFFNKDAEDLFWDYYKSQNHTFCKDLNEAERLMSTPWWLKEKEEDDYDTEAEWGEEASGFQIRIEGDSGRRAFYSDKIPVFKIDLLNTGDKTFACAALEQFCEVGVDGKWYKWNGPAAADVLAGMLKPKNVNYDFLVIKLTENWGLKSPSTKEDKSQTIPLSLGTHSIRVKYKTMPRPDSPAAEAVSNSLKFQIIAPRSAAGG